MFQKFQTFWDYCPFLSGKYDDHLPTIQALKVQACSGVWGHAHSGKFLGTDFLNTISVIP